MKNSDLTEAFRDATRAGAVIFISFLGLVYTPLALMLSVAIVLGSS